MLGQADSAHAAFWLLLVFSRKLKKALFFLSHWDATATGVTVGSSRLLFFWALRHHASPSDSGLHERLPVWCGFLCWNSLPWYCIFFSVLTFPHSGEQKAKSSVICIGPLNTRLSWQDDLMDACIKSSCFKEFLYPSNGKFFFSGVETRNAFPEGMNLHRDFVMTLRCKVPGFHLQCPKAVALGLPLLSHTFACLV